MDRILAASPRLAELERSAIEAMETFAAEGPFYVSVSWGKDSVAVAHLSTALRAPPPLYWFPAGAIENPDCVLVRDAFLARWPARYFEIGVTAGGDPDAWDVHGDARRASGIRAEESATRARSAAYDGLATMRSCRPILRWTGAEVFAYLARHDLPIHPAYACSLAGTLDRGRIRVGPLGGDRGSGRGRAEWERAYYPVATLG